jgi:MFS family permease
MKKNATAVWACFILSASLTGFGASLIWVGQGRYISECATSENMGLYNSIFWAIYMGSILVGNLFSAFVIVQVNEAVFYMIMTCLSVLASLVFLFLRQPEKVNNLYQEHQVSVSDLIQLLKTKRMIKTLPLMIFAGICLAGNAGVFIPLLDLTMDQTPKCREWSDAVRS